MIITGSSMPWSCLTSVLVAALAFTAVSAAQGRDEMAKALSPGLSRLHGGNRVCSISSMNRSTWYTGAPWEAAMSFTLAHADCGLQDWQGLDGPRGTWRNSGGKRMLLSQVNARALMMKIIREDCVAAQFYRECDRIEGLDWETRGVSGLASNQRIGC